MESKTMSLVSRNNSTVRSILDGKLEEIAEAARSYYELPPPPKDVDLVAFALKVNAVRVMSANK